MAGRCEFCKCLSPSHPLSYKLVLSSVEIGRSMYLITACIRIINDYSFKEVYRDLKWLEAETQNEDGNIFFSIYPSNKEKGEFILWKKWKNKEALTAHFQMSYTKKLVDKGITEVFWINETQL